jgi:hypothetical protein
VPALAGWALLIVIAAVLALKLFGPVQLYAYPDPTVPPLPLAVKGCELPAHTVALGGVTEQLNAVGWLTVMDWLVVQPFASCRYTVCEPADNPMKVYGDVCGMLEPPSIWTCNVPVPPEKVAVTLPSLPPLQLVAVWPKLRFSAAGWVTVINWGVVQPLTSFTVTVREPADSPVKVYGEVCGVYDPPSMLSWNGPLPEKVAVIWPSLPPLQVVGV